MLFVAGTYWLSLQQTRAQSWISHTHEVLASVAGTRADLAGIQDTQQRFVTSGRDEDLRAYSDIRRALVTDVQRLRDMTGDNPVQQRNAAEVQDALGPRLAGADAANAARRTEGREAAQALVEGDAAVGQARQLRDALQRMTTEEARLLATRLSDHEKELNVFWAAIAIMLAALLLALAFLYVQQRRRERAEHDLLESERRFHVMTDSVTDYAILMLDVAGNVQSWNPGAQRIKGYQAAQILGRHFSCFYTPEDLEAGMPQQALTRAAGEGRYAAEGWRVRKDGSRFWASVLITPLRDPQGHVTGYSKITRDLTDRMRAEEGKRARELSSRLIAAQEEERRHVARELHDETGQSLTLIRMRLAELAQLQGPAAEVAADCTKLVDGAVVHIRGLALRLRPPMLDDLGLADALEWVLDQQARAACWRTGIDAPEMEERLPPEFETACFRIGQEAITNAARYSAATEVRLVLRVTGEQLVMEVRDNGRGFELARYSSPHERGKHFGLVSMAERAALVGGQLVIDTAPGRGTCIRASFPVPGAGRLAGRHEEVPVA